METRPEIRRLAILVTLLPLTLAATARSDDENQPIILREFTAPVEFFIAGLAWDGEHLWFQETRDDGKHAALHEIDVETMIVRRSCPVPGGSSRGLAWSKEMIWTGDTKSDCIHGVEPKGCGAVREFCSPRDVCGVAWDADTEGGPYLWYADGDQDLIIQMRATDGEAVRIEEPPASGPGDMAWDADSPGGPYLWLIDFDVDRVFCIRVADWSVQLQFPAPGAGQPFGIAWDGSSLWTSDLSMGTIYQIEIPPFAIE